MTRLADHGGVAAVGRVAPGAVPSLEEILAHSPGENFPVASRLLPRRHRDDLLAIYGFARLVDDLGDEWPGDRLAALHWLEDDLDAALGGRPSHPATSRIAAALAAHGAGAQPLRDLIEANRRDQQVTRYATFEDLVGYCRLSADPVGRLVLGVFDATSPERAAWSDRICTGLQLVEHWQDVAEDARAGRIYLPLEDLHRFAVSEEQLLDWAHGGAPGGGFLSALRGLLAFEVARARLVIRDGLPLVSSLSGWARWAVAGFAAGGLAALDAMTAAGFDVAAGAPKPTPAGTGGHLLRLLVATRRPHPGHRETGA